MFFRSSVKDFCVSPILAIILVIGVIFGITGAVDFVSDMLLGLFILGVVIPLIIWVVYIIVRVIKKR